MLGTKSVLKEYTELFLHQCRVTDKFLCNSTARLYKKQMTVFFTCKWLWCMYFFNLQEKKTSDFYLKVMQLSATFLLNCDSFLFI